MSANKFTLPADTASSMSPPTPSRTTTRFGTAAADCTFRFDDNGLATPAGHTVTDPGADAFTAVTFNTTAVASAGTPATPATCTCNGTPATTGATGTEAAGAHDPPPVRVSNTRHGSSAVYNDAAPPSRTSTGASDRKQRPDAV